MINQNKTASTIINYRSIIAFGVPFTLYLLTLAPTVYNLDSAELTTAAATGGIVRSTGYPFYLMVGYIWSFIPIGDVGYRMNLLSAFNGALTILLAERILHHCKIESIATLSALGLLMSAPYFWAMSLIAEVYTMHTAFMAGLILLLLQWKANPTAFKLALVALTLGLSLAHHGATVLLIPGLVYYILITNPRQALAPKSLILATTALMVGLSAYLYLPLRYQAMPAFNYAGGYDATGTFQAANLQTFKGLWWLISGKSFQNLMFAYQGSSLWEQVKLFIYQLWQAFFVIGIGPGILGIIILIKRNWQIGIFMLILFTCNISFYISYRVPDKPTMFLPTYLIWALWLAYGYQELLIWIKTADTSSTQWGYRILQSIIIIVVLLATAWNWQLLDLSNDWSARERGEAILQQVKPNALVLGHWDSIPVIQYLQLVEGQRPDVIAINRFMISRKNMVQLVENTVMQKPVYIDFVPPEFIKIFNITFNDPMYYLQPKNNSLENN